MIKAVGASNVKNLKPMFSVKYSDPTRLKEVSNSVRYVTGCSGLRKASSDVCGSEIGI
jgi:hypothetical protein